MKGFRDFILRGNIVDLAVAVVIGLAFNDLVKSFTTNLVNPLVGAITGKSDLSSYALTVGKAHLRYGRFLTDIINFVILAAVVYFFIVVPVSRLLRRIHPDEKPAAPTKECPECLSSIPVAAVRCSFCTVPLPSGS
ncbi:MAG: large conductance mechanosensitive channel protein MscL [Pseudonocardiales bacterium]